LPAAGCKAFSEPYQHVEPGCPSSFVIRDKLPFTSWLAVELLHWRPSSKPFVLLIIKREKGRAAQERTAF